LRKQLRKLERENYLLSVLYDSGKALHSKLSIDDIVNEVSQLAFRIEGGGLKLREPVPGFTMADPTQLASDGSRVLIVPESGWEIALKGNVVRPVGASIVSFSRSAVCG